MCGRYVKVTKLETIEKLFKVLAKPNQRDLFTPDYNIGPGKLAAIITQEEPGMLQLAKFGLTPFWAKKQMYLFNARSEGDFNKENNPNYTGGLGILNKPAFREPIRNKRCLIIADCFYEGPEKEGLSKPYLVYLHDRRPFAFAGIYDKWVDKSTGEEVLGFSIITTTANELLQKIGHHRSPVILPRDGELNWLSSKVSLSKATQYLKPYPSRLMNAYPVNPAVKNPKNNGRGLVEPIGQRINTEYEHFFKSNIEIRGMGHKKDNFTGETWGEYLERKKSE